MARPKRPIWPSDDQVREQKLDDEVFTDDGRKVADAEHVGARAPDADPDRPPPRPPPRDRR